MAKSASAQTIWHDAGQGAHSSVIFDPATSVEEKLAALNAVIRHPNAESIALLRGAVELVGLSRTIRVVERGQGIPKGGEVAGMAARGLAACAHFGGLKVLQQILENQGISPIVRETAAYGLAGFTHPAVFDLYVSALSLTEPDIRFRVILSLRESLDRTPDVEVEHVQRALLALCDLLVTKIRSLRGGEQDLIVSILWRYIGTACEDRLGGVLLHSLDRMVVRGVLEVLRRRDRKSTRDWIVKAFMAPNRPAFLYQLLAEDLRRRVANDQEIAIAVSTLVRRYSIRQRLAYVLSATERTRRASHMRAALTILQAC